MPRPLRVLHLEDSPPDAELWATSRTPGRAVRRFDYSSWSLTVGEARELMLNENLDAGSAGGGTKARRNSAASTVACSARRLSEMSRACGSLPLVTPPTHVDDREDRGSWSGPAPSIHPTLARVPMN
jgi:hypothetical protein